VVADGITPVDADVRIGRGHGPGTERFSTVQPTFQSTSLSPKARNSRAWTLTASTAHNARSSYPPNPNQERSNCSTALRHSPKHADRTNKPNI